MCVRVFVRVCLSKYVYVCVCVNFYLDLGDLTDQAAHGSRRGVNHHRLTGLRPTEPQKPEVGGHPAKYRVGLLFITVCCKTFT